MIIKNSLLETIHAFRKYATHLIITLLMSFSAWTQQNEQSVTYFEDFTEKGYPNAIPENSYWSYYNEIYPTQDTWDEFIPGDGNAYVTVDTDISNDLDWKHPFQSLIFGGVGENHRLEVRMKGAVVDGGLVSFLFTYEQEGSTFNEVDLELVANDSSTPAHPTLPADGGWTDARFNTWRNANENTNLPFTGTKKAVVDGSNEKISLIDDEFHTYTIEWRFDQIDFYIDQVLQETITTNIATGKAEVIFGFRQLPWAGAFNWNGTHTMVIDYLKIEPLDRLMVARDDSFAIDIDTPTTLDVLSNDTSDTNITSFDPISEEGFTISAAGNLLTYTPSDGFEGRDNFTYTIEDENGVESTATVNLAVGYVPAEDVPIAKNDAVTITQNSNNYIIDVLSDNGSGADDYGTDGPNASHPVSLTSFYSNQGGQLTLDGTNIKYTPLSNFTGTDTFDYLLTDYSGDASRATVTVTVVEADTPSAVADESTVAQDSANSVLDVLDNDSFGSDGPATSNSLSIAVLGQTNEGGNITITTANKISYTPGPGYFGVDSFSYTITDSNGDQDTALVTINVTKKIVVNGVPFAKADAVSITQNSVDNSIDVYHDNGSGADDFGTDGPLDGGLTMLSGALSGASEQGIITIDDKETESPLDDTIVYTPNPGYIGLDHFYYMITDASGDTAIAQVTINVLETNELTAVNDVMTVLQDSDSNSLDVLANDSFGSSGAAAQDFLVIDTANYQGDATIIVNDGVVMYTPATGFDGIDTFNYTIKDANNEEATATVSITVSTEIVSTSPIAKDDALIVSQNSNDNIIYILEDNGFGADSFGSEGPNTSHPISIASYTDVGGKLTLDGTTVVYTPRTGFIGEDTFNYTITDAKGIAASANVSVTVQELPLVLTAINDSYTVVQETVSNTLDVLGNDILVEGTSMSAFDAISVENGSITFDNNETPEDNSDDFLIYTPAQDFSGTDSFSYTLSDGNDTATASVTVTVGQVAVVAGEFSAKPDTFTVNQNSLDNSLNVFIDNGSGADNYGINGPLDDGLTFLNGVLTASSEQGILAINDQGTSNPLDDQIEYTPNAGFVGVDHFYYMITDAEGRTALAQVSITVIEINTLTATADISSVLQDSDDNTIDILANDSFGEEGPATENWVVIDQTSHSNGATIVFHNGTVTYTPALGFSGVDSFTYTIKDAIGEEASATVTISVGEGTVSSEPVAQDDSITVLQDSENNVIYILEDNGFGEDDFGLNGPSATHPISGIPSHTDMGGTLELVDNTVVYTPRTGFYGLDQFRYILTDLNGNSATAQVSITVVLPKNKSEEHSQAFQEGLKVYPNPSQGNVQVSFYSDIAEKALVILSDVTGKVIYQKQQQLKIGKNNIDFHVSIAPGITLLKVFTQNTDFGTKKILFN